MVCLEYFKEFIFYEGLMVNGIMCIGCYKILIKSFKKVNNALKNRLKLFAFFKFRKRLN